MSTSMLTSWVRDWGDRLQHQAQHRTQDEEKPTTASAAPESSRSSSGSRRSVLVADIDIEKTVEDMRLLVLEKEVNLLREENELIKRLLDQMLDNRSMA